MNPNRLAVLEKAYKHDPNVTAVINELRAAGGVIATQAAMLRNEPVSFQDALRAADAAGELTPSMRAAWLEDLQTNETPEISPEDEMRAWYRQACATLRQNWAAIAQIELLAGKQVDGLDDAIESTCIGVDDLSTLTDEQIDSDLKAFGLLADAADEPGRREVPT